jgi:hypothetical protein
MTFWISSGERPLSPVRASAQQQIFGAWNAGSINPNAFPDSPEMREYIEKHEEQL